jgi:RimJ/RimL family protein N-acetyltransferase
VILRTLETRRLTLVAANAEIVRADLEGSGHLAGRIDAEVPENWPPELYGRQVMRYALQVLEGPGKPAGWSFWYLLGSPNGYRELLGIGEFKGGPDESGTVEIAYSILNQFRSQGYATEAVGRLLAWAFSHQNVQEVCAETLPYLRQSIRVLEKNGFSHTGSGSEHGVIRYAVKRPDRR